MADSFKAKQITSLTENTSMADTDIVPVGNAGTSTLRRSSGRIFWKRSRVKSRHGRIASIPPARRWRGLE